MHVHHRSFCWHAAIDISKICQVEHNTIANLSDMCFGHEITISPGYFKSETTCVTNVETILSSSANKASISKHSFFFIRYTFTGFPEISDFAVLPMAIIEFEYLLCAVCDVAPKRDNVYL